MSDASENTTRSAAAGPTRGATNPGKKPLMRSLGEFVGHIAKGITTDPSKPSVARQTIREQVEEEERETPQGKMILRRTTIEEIEMQQEKPSPPKISGV